MRIKKLKILRAIIVTYAISMVNAFLWGKGSSKQLLHDQTVLHHVAPRDFNLTVALLGKPARAITLAAILAFGWLLHDSSIAYQEHGAVRCGGTGLQACILTSSPFVNNVIKAQGEVRYCVDQRGINYPGFRSQVSTVMARFAADLKVSGAREVSYSDSACTVKNSMRDDHPCSGCGAWIYTGAYPLLIEYNAKQGFSRWDSTIGHEAGHGFCLLDEHYDKVGFRSWILTYGYWQHGAPTVMDGGTYALAAYAPVGIWYLTPYDLARCEETIGRSLKEPPPPPPPVVYPFWDGATWHMCDPSLPDAQCYWAFYSDQWYDKFGRPEWGPQGALADGSFEQFNWRLGKMYRGGFKWTERLPDGSYTCLSGCW